MKGEWVSIDVRLLFSVVENHNYLPIFCLSHYQYCLTISLFLSHIRKSSKISVTFSYSSPTIHTANMTLPAAPSSSPPSLSGRDSIKHDAGEGEGPTVSGRHQDDDSGGCEPTSHEMFESIAYIEETEAESIRIVGEQRRAGQMWLDWYKQQRLLDPAAAASATTAEVTVAATAAAAANIEPTTTRMTIANGPSAVGGAGSGEQQNRPPLLRVPSHDGRPPLEASQVRHPFGSTGQPSVIQYTQTPAASMPVSHQLNVGPSGMSNVQSTYQQGTSWDPAALAAQVVQTLQAAAAPSARHSPLDATSWGLSTPGPTPVAGVLSPMGYEDGRGSQSDLGGNQRSDQWTQSEGRSRGSESQQEAYSTTPAWWDPQLGQSCLI